MTQRVFIAIPTNEVIAEIITNIQKDVNLSVNWVRWVHPNLAHITLIFLGETTKNRLELIKNLLQDALKETTIFNLQLSRLGAFPNSKMPRIVYLSINEPNTAPLTSLQKRISIYLSKNNINFDKKTWTPHITIGRIPEPQKINMKFIDSYEKYSWPITHIDLVESLLGPNGPQYKTLAEYKLLP